ncbi:MAG: hypothetical protein ACI828_001726 [Flavobacteriales bacterium]|jgi:hypothetical protein
MKQILIAALCLSFITCKESKKTISEPSKPEFIDLTTLEGDGDKMLSKYMKTITEGELKEMLYVYASDEMEGRNTGEPGQKKAAAYLRDYYKSQNIQSGTKDGNYYQIVPESYFRKNSGLKASENVLAFIEGSEKPEEVLVISAHLDHVGMDQNGNVFNGADDDGSGTVALLEIAEAFKQAKEDGVGPRRSILLLHVTGEEKGLYGSKYYTENPVYPLANTIANLNIDMIGRNDDDHLTDNNYVYLIGSKMLSQELHDLSAAINMKYFNMNLDYRFDAPNDPNRFYYRSDHYNFAKHKIPVIFYFNGVHDDYHRISDTADKINYPLLAERTKLVFATAWELANRKNRPALTPVAE